MVSSSRVHGEEKTTYLLTMKDGTLKKVTVPSSWRVTFGPLMPGSKGVPAQGGTALRFYSSKEKQHAVFTDVESFRDTSIEIEERVTETKHESFIQEGGGEGERIIAEVQVHKWQNPDRPPEAKPVVKDQPRLRVSKG